GKRATPANKPADAFDELRKAAALHPRDARAQEDLAIALQWRQPTDETERMPLRAMERVMDVASTDPEAALRFARLEDRDANKRRAALETALAAHPDNAALLDALANYRLGRGEGAATELKQALALRFDDAEARGDLVSLALDRGELNDALKLLGETLAIEPATLYPRLRAAELLSENGRANEASKAYAQAIALAPDDPEPHEQLGRHRLRLKDDSGALAAFT